TETADGVIKNINNVSNDATKHVDDKLIEFNGLLETGGFLTPDELGNQLGELEWQKYKLTNDDGGIPFTNLSSNIDELNKFTKTGFYYIAEVPGLPSGVSSVGFLNVY